MPSPRLPALLVIAGAVAGGLVLAASDDPAASPSRPGGERTIEAGVAMPAARPAGSLSSTWYCAGGTGEPDSLADHTVIIENIGAEPLTAALTVLAGEIAPPLAAPTPAAPGATTTTSTTTTDHHDGGTDDDGGSDPRAGGAADRAAASLPDRCPAG